MVRIGRLLGSWLGEMGNCCSDWLYECVRFERDLRITSSDFTGQKFNAAIAFTSIGFILLAQSGTIWAHIK